MLAVNDRIAIPDDELDWSFVRSGGPGGQNVNKVASKAVLRWDLAGSPSVPDEIKAWLKTHCRRRITNQGEMVITSQRWRDQERNRQDCLDKLREMIEAALVVPKVRKPTRVSRGAKRARLADKRRRSAVKQQRRPPGDE